MDPFWSVLALRMLATAAIVIAASLAIERLGPVTGALVATLPLSAGPAYVFLAQDHGPAFLADSAVASLLSVAGTGLFMTAHAAVAPHARTGPSLAAALGAWLATILVLDRAAPNLLPAFLAALAANAGGAFLTRSRRRAALPAALRPRLWHYAVRAGSVMALVALVTIVGHALGPHAAGLATLAPVVFTSLIPILQPRIGGAAMASVCANSLDGMVGYAFALALLSLGAIPLGSWPALALALATCVGWNLAVFMIRREGKTRSGGRISA